MLLLSPSLVVFFCPAQYRLTMHTIGATKAMTINQRGILRALGFPHIYLSDRQLVGVQMAWSRYLQPRHPAWSDQDQIVIRYVCLPIIVCKYITSKGKPTRPTYSTRQSRNCQPEMSKSSVHSSIQPFLASVLTPPSVSNCSRNPLFYLDLAHPDSTCAFSF